MLPTEAAALGMAIEEMEKPAAVERMQEGRRLGAAITNRSVPPVAQSEREGYRSRDIAAEAVGMGEATYRRIKTTTWRVSGAKNAERKHLTSLLSTGIHGVSQAEATRSRF